jgi:hypothetical protein
MANDDALSESIQMIKAGRKAEAQLVLEPYIQANPHAIQAWMWEAEIFPADADKIRVLEICLEHNPGQQQVQHGLEILRARCGIHASLMEMHAPEPVDMPAAPDPMPASTPLTSAEPSFARSPAARAKPASQVLAPDHPKSIKHPDWSSSTGMVDTSVVLRVRSQLPMFRASIAARYVVAGKEYHVQHSAGRKNSLASMDAEILTSTYPAGSKVIVRYDPKHPGRAIVDDWDSTETRRKLKQFKDKPEVRKILSLRNRKRMLNGLYWAVGGVVATTLSILIFSKLGVGFYVVFGGAILFGTFTFVSGLVSWLWYMD